MSRTAGQRQGWRPDAPSSGFGEIARRPDLGEFLERELENAAQRDDGAETRGGEPAGFDLAQRFGGDTGRAGHLGEVASFTGGSQSGSESAAGVDLGGGEWEADHSDILRVVLKYRKNGIEIPSLMEVVMVELKTPGEIEKMRVAGAFVAEILAELRDTAAVGVNLLELERIVRERIRQRGAQSCYWDYAPSFGRGPFRNTVCLSVNDAVLHGLPFDYTLRDGDVLSMDLAVRVDGWAADAAVTVIVGTPRAEDQRLVRATEEALAAAIEAAVPGNRIGDVSAAIAAVARAYGYPVNTEFGGHGIGRTMHEDLHIPNDGTPGRGFRLRPGLTMALEPWFARTTRRIVTDPDGWTIRSADGSRTAHSEHTVAVTADGPRVLTAA